MRCHRRSPCVPSLNMSEQGRGCASDLLSLGRLVVLSHAFSSHDSSFKCTVIQIDQLCKKKGAQPNRLSFGPSLGSILSSTHVAPNHHPPLRGSLQQEGTSSTRKVHSAPRAPPAPISQCRRPPHLRPRCKVLVDLSEAFGGRHPEP